MSDQGERTPEISCVFDRVTDEVFDFGLQRGPFLQADGAVKLDVDDLIVFALDAYDVRRRRGSGFGN